MKGGLRDIHDPCDGGLRDPFLEQGLNFAFLAVEFRFALRPFGPPEPLASGFRCRQALFRPFGNQIAFDLGKEPKEGNHRFGLEILFPLESDRLFKAFPDNRRSCYFEHDLRLSVEAKYVRMRRK